MEGSVLAEPREIASVSPIALAMVRLPLLLDALERHARTDPQRHACYTVTVKKGQLHERPVSFELLAANVWRLARVYEANGLKPGDRIVLSIEDSEHFLTAILAAMAAGVIAV